MFCLLDHPTDRPPYAPASMASASNDRIQSRSILVAEILDRDHRRVGPLVRIVAHGAHHGTPRRSVIGRSGIIFVRWHAPEVAQQGRTRLVAQQVRLKFEPAPAGAVGQAQGVQDG